ncbi:MAG: mechanosensitive ion channel domain-containing protein [Pseudomonadota bacterium]
MQRRFLIFVLTLLLSAAHVSTQAAAQATDNATTDAAASSDTDDPALKGVLKRSPALPEGAVAGGASQGGAPLATPSTVATSLEGIREGQARQRTAPASTRPATQSADRAPNTVPTADAGSFEEGEDSLGALRRVIEDPEARAKLLGALAALEAADDDAEGADGPVAGPAEGADDAAEAGAGAGAGVGAGENAAQAVSPPRLSLGRRVADATRAGVEELLETVNGFFIGLMATQRRLSGFADVEQGRLLAIVIDVGAAFVLTFAVFFALRLLARPLWLRLGRYAKTGSYWRGILILLASTVIDVVVVLLAWASGYLGALFLRGEPGQIDVEEALFLNAFFFVELIKSVLRIFIAPSEGRIRPLPLTDGAARYWNAWSNALISLLGYGIMMLVPIVNAEINIFTGRATSVLIFVIFLVISMVLVLLNRRAPTAYFQRRRAEEGGDVTIGAIAAVAPLFPLAVIAYLFTLFIFAVANTDQVTSIVLDTLKVIAVVGLGSAAVSVLTAASRRGVQLPGKVTETLPLLERRLNTFVPAFLSIVRFIVFLAVIGAAIEITGLFDVTGWLDATLGGDAAATFVSVVLIVLAAFAVWLGLSSWIEYRLTPRGYRIATSREQTLLTLLRNAATIGILLIATMFSLSELGINIAPLIASAGVLGLAIGFGAQKLVQDIITGIFIQFENACNVGDVITVGGTTGTVEKLTIRSVSLRDLDGTFHVIPFSSVDMVSNYMRGFAYHVADLGIAYREDTDEGKEVMLDCFRAMKEDPEWRGDIIGELEWFGVQSLGDSAVVLRARIKVRPGKQWAVGRRYNELLKKACDERGIEIPFPHMTVWMGEGKDGAAPPVHLRSEGDVAAKNDEQPGLRPDTPQASDREKSRKPLQDEPLENP